MLEFDDIQHILLTRAPALTGRYEFLSFATPAAGRAWLAAIQHTVQSAATMRASVDRDKRWVTVAFTWNGLRALGVDAEELPDGLRVRGGEEPMRGVVRSWGDHRIAMAFGVLGALAGNEITVDDRQCVGVSYPSFWDDLARVLH